MQNNSEVLGAAMLAKMVGSHLVGVDQLTVERSNSGGAANKINMQNFIAPLQGGRTVPQNHEIGASPDVVKAYENLNELALQSIPDVGQTIQAPNVGFQQPQSNINAGSPIVSQQPSRTIVGEEQAISLITRSDIDSIRNSLKGIDKSLVSIVKYLQNSKTKKHD